MTLQVRPLVRTLARTVVPSGYESEATALFSRMTPEPDTARKTIINTLVSSLKSSGVWSKLDLLYIHAAHDTQAGKINWKANTFPLTEVNAPTFAADRGYTGNGSSMELTSTWDGATDGVQFQRDSAHIGAFAITAGAGTNTFDFGETTGTNLGVRARVGASSVVRVNVNGSSSAAPVAGTVPVHIMGIRRDSGAHLTFRQGAQVQTSAAAPTTTSIGISLPIPSNFTTAFDLSGLGGMTTLTNSQGIIFSDSTNDRAQMTFSAGDLANRSWAFSFMYLIK